MESDAIFYSFFHRYPELLFHLVQLPQAGQWRMESLTVKTTEKRMDGFMQRVDAPSPFNCFVEFQSYWDPSLYWRLYREISTWYEAQVQDSTPFLAVLVFLTRGLDPKDERLKPGPSCKLVKVYLKEWLQAQPELTGPWLAFKPLLARGLKQVRKEARTWYRQIEQLPVAAEDRIFLEQLFQSILLGSFKNLTRKEIEHMLQLFPLKESRAVQECMAEARLEGLKEGIEKGKLEGIEKGKLEGIEKGKLEGIEKGKLEGIEKGKLEGIEKGKLEGIEKGKLEGERLSLMQSIQTLESLGGLTPIPLELLQSLELAELRAHVHQLGLTLMGTTRTA